MTWAFVGRAQERSVFTPCEGADCAASAGAAANRPETARTAAAAKESPARLRAGMWLLYKEVPP
jgi:hypothetical protein